MNRLKIFLSATLILLAAGIISAQTRLTLENAMEIALENSPEIKKSRLNMEQNKEYLNAQLASLKSKFSFEVTPFTYSKTDTYNDYFSQWYTSETKGANGSLTIAQPIKFSDGTLVLKNDFGYQDNYAESNNSNYTGYNNYLYLQYTQPLFTYNRTKMNLERNQLSLENATLAYSLEMLNLERLVSQAFYSIYQKQMAYEIASEEYENQKVSKEIIERKVEGDLSAREELYQAELNLATSKSGMDNSLVNLENAKDQFKQLIGLSLYDEVEVITDINYKPVEINLEKAIENSLQQRLELIQRQISLDNAQFNLIETSAFNEFRGNVSLSVGIMGNNEKLSQVYDRPTKSPQVGITFSIPIFDWGERRARMRAAEIEIETQEIDKTSLENDIIINIRQVYRNLNNLIMQIEIAKQNERNAQLTYEINLERYKNGDLTSIDLQRFQNQLSTKKMEMANALINYKLELLNMKIQSLWDFENNTSFVPQELQNNLNQ